MKVNVNSLCRARKAADPWDPGERVRSQRSPREVAVRKGWRQVVLGWGRAGVCWFKT